MQKLVVKMVKKGGRFKEEKGCEKTKLGFSSRASACEGMHGKLGRCKGRDTFSFSLSPVCFFFYYKCKNSLNKEKQSKVTVKKPCNYLIAVTLGKQGLQWHLSTFLY